MQNSPASPIRVALVEDDVNFQQALAGAVRDVPDMVLVSVATSLAQGLQLLKGEPMDVLLVDLGLPDGSGIDVIRSAQVRWPRCNIMVSTAFGDEGHVMRSLEAGATGYLLKDSEPQGMLAEIRSLHAGGSPISPLIARRILTRFRQLDKPTPLNVRTMPDAKLQGVLSAREQQVLELITKGFSYDEIAALMSVSRHTVLTFVRRVYSKLQVTSKTEAIYEARKHGLLPE